MTTRLPSGTAALLFSLFVAIPVMASHEGGSMQLKTCVRRAGEHDAYWAHLTAFQGRERYCYNIPDAAPAVLVFDLKRKMQEEPVAAYVSRADDSGTILEREPTRYTAGIIRLDVPFEEPGEYVARLDAGEVRLEFPLSVGIRADFLTTVTYLGIELMKKPNLLILFFLMTFSLLAAWRFLLRDPQENERDHR